MMDWVSMWPAALAGGMAAAVLGGVAWRLRGRSVARQADQGQPSDSNAAKRPRKQGRPPSYDKLDTVIDWEPSATRLLTHAEREAVHLLRKALPDYMVLGQVPVARFIKVPTRNSYAEWQRRVGSLCVDLVVCDMATNVLAAVEVRKEADADNERLRRRHKRIDKVLQAAGIPVHVWLEGSMPHPKAVREAILGPNAASVRDHAADRDVGDDTRSRRDAEAAALVFAMQTGAHDASWPLEDRGLDFNLDDADDAQAGEGKHASTHRDPPPSTWFDDLDATSPAPLDELEPASSSR